jgi:ribosomal protein S18 acetylase RimI-like enzyme
VANRRGRRRAHRRAAKVSSLTPAVIAAGGLTLIPLTTEVAHRLVDGRPLGFDCTAGWPHEDTVPGIRLALDAGFDPGWLVVRDGVVVGECAVKGGRPYGLEAEISYGLAGPQRGRGLGTEMVAALSAWLLDQPGIDTVTAEVRRDNIASIRVLEKAGFHRQPDEASGTTYLRFERKG